MSGHATRADAVGSREERTRTESSSSSVVVEQVLSPRGPVDRCRRRGSRGRVSRRYGERTVIDRPNLHTMCDATQCNAIRHDAT
jgi:hypothetical protein